MSDEIWKPIPGYEGLYLISNYGRIYGLKRDRIHSCPPDDGGYPQTGLSRDGKMRHIRVHTMVALVFLGECPEGFEVNHIDLNKLNNRADNLEYITHKSNIAHALDNGAFKRYDDELVDKVIELLNQRTPYLSQKDIALKLGVSPRVVNGIASQRTKSYDYSELRYRINSRKLSPNDLTEIRALLTSGGISQRKIAERFGIHESNITRIKQGKIHEGL